MDGERIRTDGTIGLVGTLDFRPDSDWDTGLLDLERVQTAVNTIYLAGFFDTRERLRPVRDAIEEYGWYVTATWLDEPDGAPEQYYGGIAARDIRDILAARTLAVDTLDVTPRGGREVELGYALAAGKRCYVVGPRRNVFHHLVPAFDTWEDFIERIVRGS